MFVYHLSVTGHRRGINLLHLVHKKHISFGLFFTQNSCRYTNNCALILFLLCFDLQIFKYVLPLGRCLRRALDQKVRNLRKMISVDEDITTELDKVVCRLMKLALHSSEGRESPPPSRWMQCKLLDLLTLTEKAISRRKLSFIHSIPLKFGTFSTISVSFSMYFGLFLTHRRNSTINLNMKYVYLGLLY